MKHTAAATALFASLAAAVPQWGGPRGNDASGNWGSSGPFASFPSCVSSCRPADANVDDSNANSLCDDNDTLNTLNTCVEGSSCSEDDKSNVKQALTQLCANAGATITAAPFASYSVTSGKWPSGTPPAAYGGGAWSGWGLWASDNSITGWPTNTAEWSSWASANSLPTASAGWPSWASSHGWRGKSAAWPTSAYSDFASWTSAAGLTARPTDSAQWASITSAHPLPSDLSSAADWWRANGFPGGSAWPSAWTTNSAWASAVSNWGGVAGWKGPVGGYGPFGHGGPGGKGWGNGPWASDGSWTSGAWTSWWGTDACPASTWSGWTDASWSISAPWTTWAGCTASTTASSVITVTTTASNGSTVSSFSTSFGIRVAQATNAAVTTDQNGATTTNSDSGALPTNFALAGSAAGIIGIVAGAILL